MPPWIIAAIPAVLAALTIVLGGALVVGPFVLPLYFETIDTKRLAKLKDMTKGAFLVVADIAKKTPTTLDDDLAKVLQMVEREAEETLKEKEKKLTEQERKKVKAIARSMHADPALPSLSAR